MPVLSDAEAKKLAEDILGPYGNCHPPAEAACDLAEKCLKLLDTAESLSADLEAALSENHRLEIQVDALKQANDAWAKAHRSGE